MFWPGLSGEVKEMVAKCDACAKYQPSQQVEPLKPHEFPVRAWQRVGADIGSINGKDYLVVCDYYSGYPEVVTLTSMTSKTVINTLSMFTRHGIVDGL